MSAPSQEERDRIATGLSELVAELAAAPPVEAARHWARPPRPGDRIGRYELAREIGRGGFGVVFEARDTELDRKVAWKALRPVPGQEGAPPDARARQEAKVVAQLQHPNIVAIHDFGRTEAGPYLVLELLAGETLAARLARGPLPLAEALAVARDVARALEHAHGRGVLHLDLTPANVILGGEAGAKVLDFGLSHLLGADGPARAGTPGHMAPEQRTAGPKDARTDLWALGVLLGLMLGGERAPDRPAALPRLPPQAPAKVAALQRALTADDPAARPPGAREVRQALDGLIDGMGPRRLRKRWAAVVALAAAVLTYLAVAIWAPPRPPPPAPLLVVADVANATGDPALDVLASLLVAALEESPGLKVVPRRRLVEEVGAAKGGPARVDDAAARAAARRLGATLVLLPAVARDGAGWRVDVRAVEPASGRAHGAWSGGATAEGGPTAAVDAVAAQLRASLAIGPARPVPPDGWSRDHMTADLQALQAHEQGEACSARGVLGQDCSVHYRRAVARDPGFAAAWYKLAAWSWSWGGDRVATREALRRAAAARPPPAKEQGLIEGLQRTLDGRFDEALESYRSVTERFGEDPQAWTLGATLQRRRDEFEGSLPWLRQAVALEPEAPGPAVDLVESLAQAGHREALEKHAEALRQRAPGAATLHALSRALGWLGDPRAAEEVAGQAVDLGVGILATEDQLMAVVQQDRYGELARRSRSLALPASPVRPIGHYALAAAEAYRGRPKAGLAWLDALRDLRISPPEDALYLQQRADYAGGLADRAELRAAVAQLRAAAPAEAADQAPQLAFAGEAALAEEVARPLGPGTLAARAWRAVAQVRRGEVDAGLGALKAVAAATPSAAWRLPPVFLYAELCLEQGRDAEAAEAYRRFQALYLSRTIWRSWAYPRSLAGLAIAEARRGRTAEARAALDRYFAAQEAPEPDLPRLAEARALRARLGR